MPLGEEDTVVQLPSLYIHLQRHWDSRPSLPPQLLATQSDQIANSNVGLAASGLLFNSSVEARKNLLFL